MIICNKNKRSVGRPSLRTMTVRKGNGHATIVFSRKSGSDLQMRSENKISITFFENRYYICPDSKEGVTIKIAKNGQGLESYRISSLGYVLQLLKYFKAENIAVLLIGNTTKEINGQKYFQVLNKAIRTDRY